MSALAIVAMLWPLHGLTRWLFDDRAAGLAVLFFALLPIPAAIGHDTLADALALAFVVGALCLGESALRTGSWSAALGCGLAVGLGFLARPEVLVVAPAVILAGLARRVGGREWLAMAGQLAGMIAVAAAIVAGYAATKGAVSEKLSLRLGTRIGVDDYKARKPPMRLPPGLDDPRWDFSPKEEAGDAALKSAPLAALGRLARDWADGLGWVFVPAVVWGLVRGRYGDGSASGKRLVGFYLLIFVPIVVRHAATLGYLSGRHALALVAVAVPWAAAGAWAWADGFAARRGISPGRARRLGYAALAGLAALAIGVQLKAGHPSRWGHREAGRWLLREAKADQAVLDTRGWASFVRGGPGSGYDYWHVRQALTDVNLAYVVVGADELGATSRRAETLRAMLAYAGHPVAAFPGREGGQGDDVQVYRFDRPASWEGLRP